MAINPNVDFTVGAVLTAAQQNRFPRGVMSFTTATASDLTITTTEEVQITGGTFTAVANRYYRVTYYEPNLLQSGVHTMRIRLTNLAGTVQNQGLTSTSAGAEQGLCVAITTLPAGSQNFVATLQASTGTLNAVRTSTQYAFLLVEDIGPA